MNQYKEFQGKTLDDAIKEACDYYGVAREKLEIEILSDAKSGIFGLVGAKKASIRAARVQISDTVTSLLESDAKSRQPKDQNRRAPDKRKPPKAPQPVEGGGDRAQESPVSASGKTPKETGPEEREKDRSGRGGAAAKGTRFGGQDEPSPARGGGRNKYQDSTQSGAPARALREERAGDKEKLPAAKDRAASTRGRRDRNDGFHHKHREKENRQPAEDLRDFSAALNGEGLLDAMREEMPEFDLAQCDQGQLFDTVRSVILRLVNPIVGQVPCEVSVSGQRVRASLDCGDASGLLVGRDGQTLAAVQYLAARIISRQLGGAVRLQIDAGKYRERQDDKLRDLARYLAERVRETGRAQSTRPLSAYQRRIVHLALEGDEAVHTRSKGEGAQRRVVVYPKREAVDGASQDSKMPPDEPLLPEALASITQEQALEPDLDEFTDDADFQDVPGTAVPGRETVFSGSEESSEADAAVPPVR